MVQIGRGVGIWLLESSLASRDHSPIASLNALAASAYDPLARSWFPFAAASAAVRPSARPCTDSSKYTGSEKRFTLIARWLVLSQNGQKLNVERSRVIVSTLSIAVSSEITSNDELAAGAFLWGPRARYTQQYTQHSGHVENVREQGDARRMPLSRSASCQILGDKHAERTSDCVKGCGTECDGGDNHEATHCFSMSLCPRVER